MFSGNLGHENGNVCTEICFIYSQYSLRKQNLFHTVDQCLSGGSCAGGDVRVGAHRDGDGTGQGAVVGVKRTLFSAAHGGD